MNSPLGIERFFLSALGSFEYIKILSTLMSPYILHTIPIVTFQFLLKLENKENNILTQQMIIHAFQSTMLKLPLCQRDSHDSTGESSRHYLEGFQL